MHLAFARSRLTGMTPDRVAASIASFDFLYLSELNKRGSSRRPCARATRACTSAQAGGHVLEPRVGLHDNVWVFDFSSLYPSIIRTFNVDPLGYVAEPAAEDDLIVARRTAPAFRREPAILPGHARRAVPAPGGREAARATPSPRRPSRSS